MPGPKKIGSPETCSSRGPVTRNGEAWNAGGDASLAQNGLEVVKGESQILLRDTGELRISSVSGHRNIMVVPHTELIYQIRAKNPVPGKPNLLHLVGTLGNFLRQSGEWETLTVLSFIIIAAPQTVLL